MNDQALYEKIPPDPLIRLLRFSNCSYSVLPHWHEHTEIHFILEGDARMKCGEEAWDLNAGDCAIINSCELHEGIGGRCSFLCLILPPSFFESEHVLFQKIVRDAFLMDIIKRINERYSSKDTADRLEVKGYACLLVSHLMRGYAQESLSAAAWAGYASKRNKVNAALEYIGQHYDQSLSTKQLADRLFLSEGYFCKIFREVTGRTVIDTINRLRMDKAEEMLRHTDTTVTETALRCGISDINYFARLFKKIKGYSPSMVRKG